MKTFIQSLSFTSGAILLAYFSAVVVWFLCSVFSVSLRKLWVVIVPLVLAYCLYWSPVWFNGERRGSTTTGCSYFSFHGFSPGLFLRRWLFGFLKSAVPAKCHD